jgi:DMSO/TMAO reductase YedYZ molybdopterin-dependent catalytic subunit
MPRDPLTLDTRRTTGQRDGMAIADSTQITLDELQLSGRNHSIPLEALKHDITPIGLHYLLIHFDIPKVDAETWQIEIGGLVERPLSLTLEDVKARPSRTMPVTLECAGNGRALIDPRPMSQPWLQGAVGTAEWTGTSLAPLLEEAGVAAEANEIVFSGLDRGIQGDNEHAYERSLPVAEAMRDEILLAYEINGQPLPPQHGFPLRLIVPGWYGMTHVKWLSSISAVAEPFTGWQQDVAYHVRSSEDEQGEPVTRIKPRSLMVPPGIPEFFSRTRFVAPGLCEVEGRAWSGRAPVSRVEFSDDGGETWADAKLGAQVGEFAWRGWSYSWAAEPGEHLLCCRATDEAGNIQPLAAEWNWDGVCNNAVQRVQVVVRTLADSGLESPSGQL